MFFCRCESYKIIVYARIYLLLRHLNYFTHHKNTQIYHINFTAKKFKPLFIKLIQLLCCNIVSPYLNVPLVK